ncbi:MAG TPA: Ig-like domain-containing protein, partial [Pyrinomonadaceae bacterium]|nr:Ig-like domain-containing protein [Pyrinomonadaceae bacterium]
TDSDLNNNEVIESAVLLPDTNAAPVVKIVPLATSLFSSPANITLVANATDSDGTITAVEFFDKGVSIGLGSPTGGNDYSLTWNPAPIGTHSIIAIATDNAGRKSITDFLPFRVNGPATITITSPGSGTEFSTTSTIPLTANATYAGGSISQVAFYANGTPLGNGTMGSPNQYNFNWTGLVSGRYSIVGIATDNNGLETASNPVFVNIRINSAPTTNILSPANGSAFATPGNVVITASVVDTDGAITSVKFFDGAIQIGTGSSIGSNQYRMTWSNPSTGAHSITAVAVDDSSASVTSSPITITVSAPPSASITSPTVGAQFTAPATVSLIANASDSDGTIARTDFYANGMFIGSGTSSGPNQYSFNWTDIGIGNYNLTAVAVDNSGLATTSSSVSISVSTPVLFVANSTTLNTAENVIKGRLEALNHTVVVKTAAAAVTADADGKALVVISSTVTPSQVGTKFRTIAVPVLTWESGIYNNMGMTGSGNSDFGTKNNQSQVSITNPTHVLAAGFTGNTSVATSGTFNWGKPNGNAISIGTVVNDTAKTLIFAYPTGTLMPGLTAPARRVGLFMHDNTTLNANGIALLDAAIKWAIGGGTINGSVVIPSPSSANLTTEGLIDWAHWGRGGASVFEHKTGITQQISNFTKIGTAPLSWFNDGPTNFSWTDGTPVLSISDSPTGSNTSGAVGNGYEITVPADTNLKTLKVYVGLWFTQAKMEATLSDDSAVAYVDSSITNNGGVRFGVYTIQYKAGWPGQTLKLRYTILNQFFDPFGNVALSAVTLR